MKIITKVICAYILYSLSLATLMANEILNSSLHLQEVSIKKGMITTIKFSSIVNYFILGDELVVDGLSINENTIALSAKLADESTNLNVYTQEGNYVFVIKTLNYDSKVIPMLHINIGNDAHQNEDKLVKKIKKSIKLDNPDFDYNFATKARLFCNWWICSDKSIAPKKIWTDGSFTYLDYNTKDGVDKSISIVAEVLDDIDTPINSTIKDGVLIVHTLAKKLIIKASKKYVCIEYSGDKYDIH